MSHTVTHHPDRTRYELAVDGELAGFLDLRPAGDSVILAHTEVDDRFEGQGIGGELVRETILALHAEGKTVIPTCPFAAAYISRHPELAEHVDPSMRGQFT